LKFEVCFCFRLALSALIMRFAQIIAELSPDGLPGGEYDECDKSGTTRHSIHEIGRGCSAIDGGGEKRLAREAGELAQQVEASALTSEVTTSTPR
jgi:hypothetical protein